MSTTTTQFQRLAERRFRQINPEAKGFSFHWKFVTDGFVPDRRGNGSTMGGHFIAKANGHKPLLVIATMEQGAKDVSLR